MLDSRPGRKRLVLLEDNPIERVHNEFMSWHEGKGQNVFQVPHHMDQMELIPRVIWCSNEELEQMIFDLRPYQRKVTIKPSIYNKSGLDQFIERPSLISQEKSKPDVAWQPSLFTIDHLSQILHV